jgi:hypothetical protein
MTGHTGYITFARKATKIQPANSKPWLARIFGSSKSWRWDNRIKTFLSQDSSSQYRVWLLKLDIRGQCKLSPSLQGQRRNRCKSWRLKRKT